jgi:hypothetical protein
MPISLSLFSYRWILDHSLEAELAYRAGSYVPGILVYLPHVFIADPSSEIAEWFVIPLASLEGALVLTRSRHRNAMA